MLTETTTKVHVGTDGALIHLYARTPYGEPVVAVNYSNVMRREIEPLLSGLHWIVCRCADDAGDVHLPGDGWMKKGGPMIGDGPEHWTR